jgi:hypothetical protein
VLQGGNELCRIEGFDRGKPVSELKVSIESAAGLVPALTRVITPESHVELQDHLTLEDMGMPNEHALAEGVIQLYAQKLKKVVVADELQIAPEKVTDSELAVLCDSIRDDPPDIFVLCGCRHVTNISCLVQLSTISHLDISGCNLAVSGPSSKCARAGCHFKANDNPIYLMRKPAEQHPYCCTPCANGRIDFHGDLCQRVDISGCNLDAKGNFHLAGAIKNMGALTSLDLSSNGLGRYVKDNQWVTDKSGISPRMRSALGFLFMRFAQCLRYCRPCQCHLQYGGTIGVIFEG